MKKNTAIHKLISSRESTVLFSAKTIDKETIRLLFEAARRAPSSMNMQPWHFVYALNGDKDFDNLLSCLAPKNQEWAKNASLLICTIAQTASGYKERRNPYAWHDTAMAYANFVIQATSLGLSAHPMGGFIREKAIHLLEIPERFEPVIFAAIGYKSSDKNFPGELIKRESRIRIRKELHEFVFYGKFLQDSGF